MMYSYSLQELIRHDPAVYDQVTSQIEDIYQNQKHNLQKVKELAQRIKKEIEKISPFIQQSTEVVCPQCKDICCLSKHGYYNYEDLIYIYALSLKPPNYDFGKKDSIPCQFLSDTGCVMDRSVRPSGCNWYFCNILSDHMERRSGYGEFDDTLRTIAELWLELTDEFTRVIKNIEEANK